MYYDNLNLTNKTVSSSFKNYVQKTGSILVDGVGNEFFDLSSSISFDGTASYLVPINDYTVNQLTTNSEISAYGQINANSGLDVNYESLLVSGNTVNTFCNILDDGLGNATFIGVITGSLNGTASNANTASYVVTAQTASFVTASNVIGTVTNSQTASYLTTTNNYTVNNLTASNEIRIGTNADNSASLYISGSGNKNIIEVDRFDGNEVFVISPSGSIGIGTTTPAQKLTISTGSIQIDQGQSLAWGAGSDNQITTTNYSMTFRLLSTPMMYIEPVYGVTVGSGATLQSRLGVTGIGDQIGFLLQSPSSPTKDVFAIKNSALNYSYLGVNLNGDVGIGTSTNTASLHISGSNNKTLLQISSPTNSDIFSVSGSGNVGIGTTTPANKLDVVGNISCSVITASLFSNTPAYASNFILTGSYSSTKSSSYILTSQDNGKLIIMSCSVAAGIDVPNTLPQAFACSVLQYSTGQITITGSGGVNIHNRAGMSSSYGQYSIISIFPVTNSVYILQGDVG